MDNQHQKIAGYRDLSQAEIDTMNKVKALAAECGELMAELRNTTGLDQGNIDSATINLQQGFMWAVRSIAQPTTFG